MVYSAAYLGETKGSGGWAGVHKIHPASRKVM